MKWVNCFYQFSESFVPFILLNFVLLVFHNQWCSSEACIVLRLLQTVPFFDRFLLI